MAEHRPTKPFIQFNALTTRCYTPNDIKKLSVRSLDQTKTFDEASFPIKGGLYDPALGPYMPHDSCPTCGLRGNYCPGHYGQIELSVPVFNPLFYSVTFKLIKGSCVHCHKLLCDGNSDSVKQFIKEWKFLSTDQIKNSVAERHDKLKVFFRDTLFKRRTKCPHCKRSNGTLRNDANRAFILDFTSNITHKTKNTVANKANNYLGDANLHAEEDVEEKSKSFLRDISTNELASTSLLDLLAFSEKVLNEQLNSVISGRCTKLIWRAAEVREHFRVLWQHDGHVLRHFFLIFRECEDDPLFCPMDILFSQRILVLPTKFRPPRMLRGESYEHPTTLIYRKIMEADQLLIAVKAIMGGKSTTIDAQDLINTKVMGKTVEEKLHHAYLDLQLRVNCLHDQEADKQAAHPHPGFKQIVEKKQGIFRMNMMGKRVNYACRSVITPDPYLDVDEIGIPDIFAKKLTFKEPVNFINMSKMRESVCNGPSSYPGANLVKFPSGFQRQLPAIKRERTAISQRLTTGVTNKVNSEPSYVFRHLLRGDHLLMNRQPSLHKPSIMGHKARILKGQKALRMNYAPCKAYNADFDGDEMNGHFLQNLVAQSEAAELANVGNSYLVPKDGTPILGLIQDHVVAGVLLTLRDRFMTKAEFMQLVFSAFAETVKRINIPPPAMFKPTMHWTGKQVITTILLNIIPEDKSKINLCGKAKTALSNWKVPNSDSNPQFEMSESQVIFRSGELLCGVLDKEHYGATQYGLIHCCYELYGHKVAMKIMSCFSRLFTTFLQRHGFTLGVADILVTPAADKLRRRTIRELRKAGPDVVKKTFNLTEDTSYGRTSQMLASAYNNPRCDRSDVKQLDFTMKQVMAKFCEQINNACVPRGLIRSFPSNSLQLMIQSGAKGSMVNSIQISCALGQIELEGQRPPLTAAGRTLPSFSCFDPSPRAGGFVDQRFLTGIKPQELFFHTMAGREGLVDTAVKTSSSGYLQRCLIKHLEGISVRYDNTVRDHDGSIIQFRYGEDGLDVGRATFLNPRHFPFLVQNMEALQHTVVPRAARYDVSNWNVHKTEKYFKRLSKWKKAQCAKLKSANSGRIFDSAFHKFCAAIKEQMQESMTKEELVNAWREVPDEEKEEFLRLAVLHMDTVDIKYHPTISLGALPEKILEEIIDYMRKNDVESEFRRVMFWKGLRSYAEPGENVGLLAAQSIGEPSTQMTLNTFHFAGRGEMNVTLGIPRLREILMTAGKNISTPMTEVHIMEDVSEEKIDALKRELNPVGLKALIKQFALEEEIKVLEGRLWRVYSLRIELLRPKYRGAPARHISYKKTIREIEQRLLREIAQVIGKRFKEVLEHQQIHHRRLRAITRPNNNVKKEDGDEDGEKVEPKTSNNKDDLSTDDEDEGCEGAADEVRLKKRHMDDAADYEGEEEERDEVSEKDENELDDAASAAADEEKNEMDVDEEQEANSSGQDSGVEHIPKSRLIEESCAAMDSNRVNDVLRSHQLIVDYSYDCSNERWCEVKFQMQLKNKTKIDVMSIVQKTIEKFIVYQIPGVQKAIVREDTRNGKTSRILQVQGINIEALYKHDILNVNTLYSNDINFMLHKYGVESCGRTIEKEMNNVFGVYGIEVNPRHLSLTADYMTFTGEVLPFSRGAMASNPSPLQKMTFETTTSFLYDAIIYGQRDNLCSPSARLVTGQLHRSGTGAFDLLAEPQYVVKC